MDTNVKNDLLYSYFFLINLLFEKFTFSREENCVVVVLCNDGNASISDLD